MNLSCARAGTMLAARAAGLTSAEREALDDHLRGCASCRAQARVLDELARAVGDGIVSSPTARDRMLDRALLEAAKPRPRPWPRWSLALGGVAVMGALAALVLFPRGEPGRTSSSPPSAPRQLPAGMEIPVAHARVRAVEAAVVVPDEQAAVVRLQRGALELDVDASAHRRFRVITETFVVEVLGTRFLVDETHVEVARGAVRVLSPDGRVLSARVQAGERWPERTPPRVAPAAPVEVAPAASRAPLPTEVKVAPVAPLVPPARTLAARESTPPPHQASVSAERGARPTSAAALTPGERLARARRDLANRRIEDAQQEASAILAQTQDRRHEAEARTLLAECARARGRVDEAVEIYAVLAGRFGDLLAGEMAMFAAGRTLADAHRGEAAARWFRRYLERYPSGRFVGEARDRLAGLAGAGR